MKDDPVYVAHILESIERVTAYTAGGRDEFLESRVVQDAALRVLQTMAESTQRLSAERKAAHPEVPWREIAGFRNFLVHGYLQVRVPRVWQVIEQDLPVLREAMKQMAAELRERPRNDT